MKRITLALIASSSLNAAGPDLIGCFPDSNLRFSRFDKMAGGLSENEYFRMQERFKSIFDPFLKERFGKTVTFENCWKEDQVNAYCTRDDNDNPVIKIMGGMVRHPEMTIDGLYLLACHELGHYLGGAPRAFRGRSNQRSWSSAEGQADYFATTKCLPIIFESEKANDKAIDFYPYDQVEKAKSRCQEKTNLCIRMALAALTVSNVFHSITPYEDLPELDKKDPKSVYSTFYGHPSPQCRLDTFINGLNCKNDFKVLFDPIDPSVGACQDDNSNRPSCWYQREEKFL
jgi:hypothetical protein